MAAEVEVDGLRRLRAGLRKIDPELAQELRQSFLVVANRVADSARGRVPSRTGRAEGSIRGGVSGNNAYIQGGKRTVPYFGWLDFGSREPRKGNNRAEGPWRGSGAGPKAGRFIYPAIGENRDNIVQSAVEAIEKVADKVLPHE